MRSAGEMNILVVGEPTGEGSLAARSLAETRPHCRVALVASTTEALHQLKRSSFDLVLVDHDLAHKEEILSIPREKTTPATPPRLVVSNQVTPEARQEAHRLGATMMVGRDADGLEELSRTADRLWEIRRLRERQQLLLAYLGPNCAYGPCSTGGARTG
jgi:DNA-binding NtrC family response regulator